MTSRFGSVLVANRGEIARRVLRSARAEGYTTVAVYSDADAGAPHVREADIGVHIGPAAASSSYLSGATIIDAALRTGAGAVHPGYGFLAENAAFARACAEAGLVFVGPPPDVIELMGDKAAAKQRMRAAGVPLVPGYDGDDQTDTRLRLEAERIGPPLMIKAALGGGGKGMRLVRDLARLDEELAAARRESRGAFGDDRLILERALDRARHIEIQVLSDESGRTVALGERDCSIQRRHQKVIEEAPSTVLDPPTRRAMNDLCASVATEIGYVGAGTFEFLVDDQGAFFFLEMNTRLQVEHAVTELVTGLDLVAWQLRIAQGEPLPFTTDGIVADGHAIEARLYAEDPANGHLPASGTVRRWQPPSGVRVDDALADGSVVTADYDPMLAKIVAHGRTREEARRRLVTALERTVLLGFPTNRGFLTRVLGHPAFIAAETTTGFLGEVDLTSPHLPTHQQVAVVAAWLHQRRLQAADQRAPGLSGWSNAPYHHGRQRLEHRGLVFEVRLTAASSAWTVTVNGDSRHTVSIGGIDSAPGHIAVDGNAVDFDAFPGDPGVVWVRFAALDLDFRETLLAPVERAAAAGSGLIAAPMHGAVATVFAVNDEPVSAGQRLLVLEAMKMEHAILADVDGVVTDLVAAGTQVVTGQVLARIQTDG